MTYRFIQCLVATEAGWRARLRFAFRSALFFSAEPKTRTPVGSANERSTWKIDSSSG